MRIFAMHEIRRWWIALGVILVAVIWVGSLMPVDRLPRVGGGDKLHHFAAYAVCSFCWCALATNLRGKLGWISAIAIMGIVIEFLQGASGFRHFERADMIANALGALTGGMLTLLLPRTMFTASATASTSVTS